MKNKFFSLESFIQFHRSVLHLMDKPNQVSHDPNLNWQLQQAYELGWMACLVDLENEMNDTSLQDIIREVFE